jgi:DNA-binding MarR family transcriptional regulator
MFQDQPPDEERTITLSRKDMAAARRLLQLLLGIDRHMLIALDGDAPKVSAQGHDRSILIARARATFENRRRRTKVFGQSMFGEVAWDMLLALYIMDMSGPRHTAGDLMRLAGSPTTTANRWLGYLIAHGLVSRSEHPTDARTSFVSLTDMARTKMDEYFSGTSDTAV